MVVEERRLSVWHLFLCVRVEAGLSLPLEDLFSPGNTSNDSKKKNTALIRV